MSARPPRSRSTRLAVVAVRMAAGYLLLGAVAKAGWGAPDDLPAVLRVNARGSLTMLFQFVVGVELLSALTALIAPRLAWTVIVALLTAFLGILIEQVVAGTPSCGCFGSSVTVPPWAMLLLDAAVLGGLLATRPWSTLRLERWRPWAPAFGVAGAIGGGVWIAAGAATATVPPDPLAATTVPESPDDDTAPTASPARAPREWRLPVQMPRYVVLAPDKWVGERLRFTPLATWADVSKFPDDATLVFFYDTCDRCAKHIEMLVEEGADTSFVFLQLPTALDNTHPRLIRELPPGLHVRLPAGTRWIIETPWDLVVKDGVVTAAHAGF